MAFNLSARNMTNDVLLNLLNRIDTFLLNNLGEFSYSYRITCSVINCDQFLYSHNETTDFVLILLEDESVDKLAGTEGV